MQSEQPMNNQQESFGFNPNNPSLQNPMWGNNLNQNQSIRNLENRVSRLEREVQRLNDINYTEYNSKKWLPDEAFLNLENNTLYIVEKKYQESSGSVDEKLPNCHFKRKEYLKLFRPLGFKVNYIYVFNDWFKQSQYKDTLEYIQDMGCEYYFNEIPFEAIGLKKDN